MSGKKNSTSSKVNDDCTKKSLKIPKESSEAVY